MQVGAVVGKFSKKLRLKLRRQQYYYHCSYSNCCFLTHSKGKNRSKKEHVFYKLRRLSGWAKPEGVVGVV